MATPNSTEEFLSLVKQSGLIALPKLQAYIKERLASGGVPASARRMAQEMLTDGLLTKFQAEQILMGRYRKFELAGKYRLLERVGEGGAAAVYLCEHLSLRRPVALKILPAWKTKSREVVDRFLREARAAALVDHPNIVRIYDVEATEQNHFLVTEFVDGPNLETLVESRGPLDPTRAAQYVRQAAEALQHAHEVGMVHRDVKPSNFLVDSSGTVKLLDLGLVKLMGTDDGLTKNLEGKAVLGTIDFQAPEQAVNSSDVDIRADIYGLGATFYFLLTGQVIFPEGTVAQKLSWHQKRMPQPLREVRPEVPEKIAKIVAKMLAKDPKHRYQSPGEVADALEPFTREPIKPLEEFELPKVSKAARAFLTAWANQRKTNTPQGRDRPRPKTPPKTPIPEGWKTRIARADWWSTRRPLIWAGGGALALVVISLGVWWLKGHRPVSGEVAAHTQDPSSPATPPVEEEIPRAPGPIEAGRGPADKQGRRPDDPRAGVSIETPKHGTMVGPREQLICRLESGGWPVVFVQSMVAGQPWWCQPPVARLGDGRFTVHVAFGEESTPSGTRFRIAAVVAPTQQEAQKFQTGTQMSDLPAGLPRSDEVVVGLR
jgi:serine/threonine protein kinase